MLNIWKKVWFFLFTSLYINVIVRIYRSNSFSFKSHQERYRIISHKSNVQSELIPFRSYAVPRVGSGSRPGE